MPNNQEFISIIQSNFGNISSDIPLILPEADYLDNYVRPFDFPNFPYNFNGDFMAEIQSLLDDLSYWFDEDRECAIKCIKENKKMTNRYKNWYDVPIDYLDWYHIGFTYIDNVGFFFYTPAIMVNYLNPSSSNKSTGLALEWWSQRIKNDCLSGKLDILLNFFNKNQIKILADFLKYHQNDFDDTLLSTIYAKTR